MKRRELLFVFLISLAIALLSLIQTFIYIIKTPSGFIYPLVHNFEQDFYWYLSLMRQGWEGNLLVTSRFTPETFAPQLVNTFFPVLGMLSKIFNISLPLGYTFARASGGALLLFVSFIFARRFFSGYYKYLTFLLIIIGAPLWFLDAGAIRQVGEFWTGFDPILRITWLPHHTIANTLTIVTLLNCYIVYKNKKISIKHILIGGISGIVAVWLNPASFYTIVVSLGIALFITFIQERFRIHRIINLFYYSIILFILLLIPATALLLVQSSVFPWTAFGQWERFVMYPINAFSFLKVLGPVGLLALIGIVYAIGKKEFKWNLIIGWFMAPFIGLTILQKFIPMSNGRYLHGAYYIPAAFLAALTIANLASSLGKRQDRVINVIKGIGVILIILVSLPSFYSSIVRQLEYVKKNMNNNLVMVPDSTMEGLKFLSESGRVNRVIVAYNNISTLIPASTSYRTILGHPTFSYDFKKKDSDLNNFYLNKNFHAIAKYDPQAVWVSKHEDFSFLTGFGFQKKFENDYAVIYLK